MTPIPDVYDYVALGLMVPEPDDPYDCPDCGNYFCGPDCRPPSPVDEREPIAKEDR